MKTIFIDCNPQLGAVWQKVYRADDPTVTINTVPFEKNELPRVVGNYDIVIDDHSYIPTDLAKQCKALKHVVFLGTGAASYMNVAELEAIGIKVHTIKGYGDTAVAEQTIALMMACCRDLARMDRNIRAGTWQPREGMQVFGKTLGIVGLGGIGAEVARIATGIGMNAIAWNRTPRPDAGVKLVELDTLLAQSDVISLNLTLNDDTRGFIDAAKIARMKPGVVLVNTARGALVDEAALLAALQSGHIRHAGFDVFHNEPLQADNPLARLDNVTLSAHAAFRTLEASMTLLRRAIDIVHGVVAWLKPFCRSPVVEGFIRGIPMPVQTKTRPTIASHGATHLPSVEVDDYNIELKDDEGFLGDRASKGAFRAIIENWRKALRKNGDDPFGDEPSEEISKKALDTLLAKGDPEAAGILHGAIEEFSQGLALVIRRYLKTKGWKDTERIVVGGGFRASRVGELVIGRTAVILKADAIDIDLVPIRNDPDEAGLIGAAHLAPKWMFKAHDAILAVDIGGTNIRAGVLELNLKKAPDLSKAAVWKFELWRHADDKKVSRESAIKTMVDMLETLIDKARKEGLALAPFIGIGCPGRIDEDGSIERGAQNLPGNWEAASFHLPAAIHEAIPKIGDDDTAIVMHNDAVVQGLSEAPFMTDVSRWGVLTIGTGLGNARFTNRKDE